jgi:lipopolysaccharide biosynthesis protein
MRKTFGFKKRSKNQQDFVYSIDEPKLQRLYTKTITIKGWLVPLNGKTVDKICLKNGRQQIDIPYGFARPDVARYLTSVDPTISGHSGFSVTIELEAKRLELQIDLGDGLQTFHETSFVYPENSSSTTLYNPLLATNMMDHQDLLRAKTAYFYETEAGPDFKLKNTNPKIIAFYLPQFHAIPENDEAWGKGFTEWRNVTTAQPRFVGHLQPILPSDLGFYDLRLKEVIQDQIALAKKYGIYGFCFYYYWFSGKKILDMPIDTFLNDDSLRHNFMICWANENWTKRWDGDDEEIIISQKYLKSDPLNFIKDVEHILMDNRYMRINGRPILAVYRPFHLKHPDHYAQVWRQYFKKKYNTELYLVAVLARDVEDPKNYGFDAAIEFPPANVDQRMSVFDGHPPVLNAEDKLLDVSFTGTIYDYRAIALNEKFQNYDYGFKAPVYRGSMLSWDNDARKKGNGIVFHNSNPDLYAKWLSNSLRTTTDKENSMVFINAWNEWAEGTTLEPSLHYGHAFLKRTAEVLASQSKDPEISQLFPKYGISRAGRVDTVFLLNLTNASTDPETPNNVVKLVQYLDKTKIDYYVLLDSTEARALAHIKKYIPDVKVLSAYSRGGAALDIAHHGRRLREVGYTSLGYIDGNKGDLQVVLDWLVLHHKDLIKLEKQIIQKKVAYFIDANKNNLQNTDESLARVKEIATKIAGYTLSDATPRIFSLDNFCWLSLESIRPLLDLHLMPEDFEHESVKNQPTRCAVSLIISDILRKNDTDIIDIAAGKQTQ